MDIRRDTRKTRSGSFGWLVQQLARRINEDMSARLKEHDLSLNDFAVLMTTFEYAPMTQSEISTHFAMPPYAISRAVDRLVDLGYLARQPHPTSRRAIQVETTKAGRALAPKLQSIVRDVNLNFLAPLEAKEVDALIALLVKLEAN